jgi:hypothetical protein
VSNEWVTPLRRFRIYVRHDGNYVIAYAEKCAAIESSQRRDYLGNAWGQEAEKIVLPLNAFDACLSVADDIHATSHD